jgi:hypothetical protein
MYILRAVPLQVGHSVDVTSTLVHKAPVNTPWTLVYH